MLSSLLFTFKRDGSEALPKKKIPGFYQWLEIVYLAFKKICMCTKGTEEGMTNTRFFKEML